MLFNILNESYRDYVLQRKLYIYQGRNRLLYQSWRLMDVEHCCDKNQDKHQDRKRYWLYFTHGSQIVVISAKKRSNYSFTYQKTGSNLFLSQHRHLFSESNMLVCYFHINLFYIKVQKTSSSGAAHHIIWSVLLKTSAVFCMLVCPPDFLSNLTSLFNRKITLVKQL